MYVEFETKIKGGFPVIVKAEIAKGYGQREIYDLEILTRKGKPADFVVSRMNSRDHDELTEQVFSNAY